MPAPEGSLEVARQTWRRKRPAKGYNHGKALVR